MFKGSGVALVTPFKKNGEIDYDALQKLIEYHIKSKTDAIIVCGTTGEAPTLSSKEHLECIEACVSYANKKIPIIAGTGSNNTLTAINNSYEASLLGVDGLLLITPYYNKTTQKGLIEHYTKIAKYIDIPIILYNVPSRTGINMEAKTFAKIYHDIDQIVGIKEAGTNIRQVADIAFETDGEAYIYSGCDDLVVPTLSLGGVGVISVVANIMPDYMHDMVYNYLEGNTNLSRDMQLKILKLCSSLFKEVNPIPIKKAMELMGLINGTLRDPLIDIESEDEKILIKELKNNNLI